MKLLFFFINFNFFLNFVNSQVQIFCPNTIPSGAGSPTPYCCNGDLSLSNSVTSIGDNTYAGCSTITTITVPSTVTFTGLYFYHFIYNNYCYFFLLFQYNLLLF